MLGIRRHRAPADREQRDDGGDDIDDALNRVRQQRDAAREHVGRIFQRKDDDADKDAPRRDGLNARHVSPELNLSAALTTRATPAPNAIIFNATHLQWRVGNETYFGVPRGRGAACSHKRVYARLRRAMAPQNRGPEFMLLG